MEFVMELMLDTANLEELKFGLKYYPVCGITSNPSILKNEGNVDLYEHLKKIKALCEGRSLHVQVVSETSDEIVREAQEILERLGRDTFIKIPVSEEGVGAIKQLANEGVNITATAIYSTMQGILAVLAGAKYIAIYYNRMENNNTDPKIVISEIADFIAKGNYSAKILGASYKNVTQVIASYTSGAVGVTVPLDILKTALGMVSIGKAVADFRSDFEGIHGEKSTMLTI